ncbi:unnamed protein product, partial [Polarella glacialis]
DLSQLAVQHLMALGPDEVYVDCSFGCGGQSRLILSRLSSVGRLIALDTNTSDAALELARTYSEERRQVFQKAAGELADVVHHPIAGVLLDLRLRGFPPRGLASEDLRSVQEDLGT